MAHMRCFLVISSMYRRRHLLLTAGVDTHNPGFESCRGFLLGLVLKGSRHLKPMAFYTSGSTTPKGHGKHLGGKKVHHHAWFGASGNYRECNPWGDKSEV